MRRKNDIKSIGMCLLLILFVLNCKRESALDVPAIEKEVLPVKTQLDKRIKGLYEKYDTKFEYKWNRYAFSRGVVADPADPEDVLPYLEVFEELYFKALMAVQQSDKKGSFASRESPLTVFLLGSGINYGGKESWGEGTAGQAGNIQPNRLTLGGLNEFGDYLRNGSNEDFLSYLYDRRPSSYPSNGGEIGFIYHEYTHFMDSKHDIPKGFELPSVEDYIRGTNAWKWQSDATAVSNGFMLPYGMQNEAEDFATYVQLLTTMSKSDFLTRIRRLTTTPDKALKKYKMVYEYYRDKGIDLHKLYAYLSSDAVKNKLLAIKREYERSPE